MLQTQQVAAEVFKELVAKVVQRARGYANSPASDAVSLQIQVKMQELAGMITPQMATQSSNTLFWGAVWDSIFRPAWQSSVQDPTALDRAWAAFRIDMDKAVGRASLLDQLLWLLEQERELYTFITQHQDQAAVRQMQSALLQAMPRPASRPMSLPPAAPLWAASSQWSTPTSASSLDASINAEVQAALNSLPPSCHFWSGHQGSCFRGESCPFKASHTPGLGSPRYTAKSAILTRHGRIPDSEGNFRNPEKRTRSSRGFTAQPPLPTS
jgi:hypothetical protein